MISQEDSERGSPSSGGDLGMGSRKERGAIAAQACETCRSRKQKCDEKRPKCSTCVRFQLPCSYREPQPTKKDRTLTEILEHLRIQEVRFNSLESKIDALQSSVYNQAVFPRVAPPPAQTDATRQGSSTAFGPRSPTGLQQSPSNVYQYESATHKVLGWLGHRSFGYSERIPAYFDAAVLSRNGRAAALGLSADFMAATPLGPSTPSHKDYSTPTSTPRSTPIPPMAHAGSPAAAEVAAAYMETLNLVCPIIDTKIIESGLGAMGQGTSRTSLLRGTAMALGKVVIDASRHGHIGTSHRPSAGVKASFDDALRLVGHVTGQESIESVQTLILTASFAALLNDHHTFWRLSAAASASCQSLRRIFPFVMAGPQARLIRRCAWQCAISETYFDLELDLPPPDVEALAEEIGLPDEADAAEFDDTPANLVPRLYHDLFLAQAQLVLYVVRIHNTLKELLREPTARNPTAAGPGSDAELAAVINNLAAGLRTWHKSLPAHLSWPEDDPLANQPRSIAGYPLAVLTALLRTRYHYALHLAYRPFLYRALATPIQSQPAAFVADGAIRCLANCLRWPVAYLPQNPASSFSPAFSPTDTTPPLIRSAGTTADHPRAFFDPIRQASATPRASPPFPGLGAASAGGPSGQSNPQPLIHLLLAGAGGAAWHSTRMMLGALTALNISRRSDQMLRIRAEQWGEERLAAESKTVEQYGAWIRNAAAEGTSDLSVESSCIDPAAKWAWAATRALYGDEGVFSGEDARFGGSTTSDAGVMDQD